VSRKSPKQSFAAARPSKRSLIISTGRACSIPADEKMNDIRLDDHADGNAGAAVGSKH
jgi:hypothetical protein